jgi:hypothetical protein
MHSMFTGIFPMHSIGQMERFQPSIWEKMPAKGPARREGMHEAPPSRISVLPKLRHP